MSKSEDYLDQLLKGIVPEKESDAESALNISEENLFSDILEEFADKSKGESTEKNTDDVFDDEDIFGTENSDGENSDEGFLHDEIWDDEFFNDEISDEDLLDDEFLDEEFLKQFEQEMAKLENATSETEEIAETEVTEVTEVTGGDEDDLSFSDNLDSIISGAKEKMEVEQKPEEKLPEQDDPDVIRILESLDGIDLGLEEDNSIAVPVSEFSDIDIESFGAEQDVEAEKIPEELDNKAKQSGEKSGWMNKLSLILFGEDDEDDEEEPFILFKKKGSPKAKNGQNAEHGEQTDGKIGIASEEDLALFGEYFDTVESGAPSEEKPKKKKEKKPKQEKKPKKEKKTKKPKKEKKPKEPDNTPPLPKKPVCLIFLMIASLVALVILGANLLGYSNQLTNAKNEYAKKNYSEAFAEISGMEIKAEDMELYHKYHVMAMVSVELEAYESLMTQEFYDMALDCLVRTIGRADKYRADAETYGCIQELNELELEAETKLKETFDVSREEALGFYACRSKKEYATALAKVLRKIGLEKTVER